MIILCYQVIYPCKIIEVDIIMCVIITSNDNITQIYAKKNVIYLRNV